MSYMWDEFNIKTWDAETVVFRDGVFCPDLSTLNSTDITKKYNRDVHIIYVGEIAGNYRININILTENQPVFLTAKIKNKKPAFFNIFVKNAGKNSEFRGHVMLENFSNLETDFVMQHSASDTVALLHTKILAEKNTLSKLSGVAIIDANTKNTTSDINFSALADKTARIEFTPAQRISAVPNDAGHSASLYRPGTPQIEYLRGAGLARDEIRDALREAFLNDYSLFVNK